MSYSNVTPSSAPATSCTPLCITLARSKQVDNVLRRQIACGTSLESVLVSGHLVAPLPSSTVCTESDDRTYYRCLSFPGFTQPHTTLVNLFRRLHRRRQSHRTAPRPPPRPSLLADRLCLDASSSGRRTAM